MKNQRIEDAKWTFRLNVLLTPEAAAVCEILLVNCHNAAFQTVKVYELLWIIFDIAHYSNVFSSLQIRGKLGATFHGGTVSIHSLLQETHKTPFKPEKSEQVLVKTELVSIFTYKIVKV